MIEMGVWSRLQFVQVIFHFYVHLGLDFDVSKIQIQFGIHCFGCLEHQNKLIFYISVRISTINGIDFFSLGPILQESRPSSLFAFFFIRIRFCVGIPLVFLSQFKTCVFKTNKKSSLWFYFETAKKIPRGRVPTSTNTIYKIKTPFIDHSFWFM